jgi:hypothetical protein
MIQLLKKLMSRPVIGAAFESQRTLAHGGEHPGQNFSDALLQTQPFEAGLSQEQAVQLLLGQFPQAGFDVAADVD